MYGELEKRFVRSNQRERVPEYVTPSHLLVPVTVKVLKGFWYANRAIEPGEVLDLPRWMIDDLLVRQRIEVAPNGQ